MFLISMMMILFILSIFFLHDDVFAKPLLLHATFENPFHPRELVIQLATRTVGNIIWSCLTTVFVCLWVVVHPNIPGPAESMFITRLKIMGCMLIAPELVIVWAGRQWFAARHIAANHKDQGWTITHGFLASMGGFMLYEDGIMVKTLDIDTLERLYREGRIEWPNISKKEIEDRSKGDFLSKGIAVLQTTWFTAQCIVRGVLNISLTQLELATVAFSALNIVLSILWMNKPLGVAYPFQVHLRPSGPLHSPSLQHSPQSPFGRFREFFHVRFKKRGFFAPIYIFIIEPFNVAWSSVKDLITCETLPQVPNQFSVPTFYAPSSPNDILATLIGLCVGILFGGIHCVAWYFDFPTNAEEYIWKTSAVTITSIPLIFFLIVENVRLQTTDACFQDFSSLRILTVYASIVLYCISRAALVVLPILSLRCLPPEALLDFQWSSFIPHI